MGCFEPISPGLMRWRGQLWSEVTARRATFCAFSRRPIAPGNRVFRPITNGKNRMERLLASAVHAQLSYSEPTPSSADQTADGEPGIANNLKAPHPLDGRKAT